MDYPKPSFTADICLYSKEPDGLYVLMIRRGHDPFAGFWALPGGFVEPGEQVEDAAARELAEETGLTGIPFAPVAVFSEAGRDPRGWTMTEAFCAKVDRSTLHAVGQDDAAEARWFRIEFAESDGLLSMRLSGGGEVLTATLSDPYLLAGQLRWHGQAADGIAFDHPKILAAALWRNR